MENQSLFAAHTGHTRDLRLFFKDIISVVKKLADTVTLCSLNHNGRFAVITRAVKGKLRYEIDVGRRIEVPRNGSGAGGCAECTQIRNIVASDAFSEVKMFGIIVFVYTENVGYIPAFKIEASV